MGRIRSRRFLWHTPCNVEEHADPDEGDRTTLTQGFLPPEAFASRTGDPASTGYPHPDPEGAAEQSGRCRRTSCLSHSCQEPFHPRAARFPRERPALFLVQATEAARDRSRDRRNAPSCTNRLLRSDMRGSLHSGVRPRIDKHFTPHIQDMPGSRNGGPILGKIIFPVPICP